VSPNPVAVASPLRPATEAGLHAGRRGGNAIDAALATAAMLTVAYPASCGVGGDLLALVREPDGTITFVNASGRSLFATDVEAVRRNHDVVPIHGPIPITVPGVVGGWEQLWRRGAALPWRDALATAQSAAADGVPVSSGLAESIAETVPLLRQFPDLAALLAPGGDLLTAGQTLRQPALARTLDELADTGSAALYDGAVGRALCAGLAARGVPLTPDDLRAFDVEQSSAVSAGVGKWTVFAGRPNSQAYLVPRLLGMLDAVDAAPGVPPHRRIPAGRLALAFYLAAAERDDTVADPESMTANVDELLTEDALRKFARLVTQSSVRSRDDLQRLADVAHTKRPTGDTVAVVAADAEGRSVSLIQSLFHGFGALILEPETGILMHDRGACFALDPASPNVLAPHKRPMHTLSPVLAESSDSRLVVGTMGGHSQPQILAQVFSHLFAGKSAQSAVSLPRFTVGPWDDDETPDTVAFESDLDVHIVDELAAFPGPRRKVSPHHSRMGHAHAIAVNATDGTTSSWLPDVGTDPRADGLEA
jgi:gamma-glutamyltranspeptidase/glutathione hydrolase